MCTDVYLSKPDEREEYVLNDNGLIWKGTHDNFFAQPWNYAQVYYTHYCNPKLLLLLLLMTTEHYGRHQ